MGDDAMDRFVESWGAMGSFWGVNTSVARVHALLIASSRPWCLDEISERLTISRSNVSTCLKELRSWAVIRKVIRPGERREFWTAEPDVWKMLFSILRERKKREFDPAFSAVGEALAQARGESSGLDLDRLEQMEEMMNVMNTMGDRVLSDEERAQEMLSFLTGMQE
jgi:DNA-binding transcriptional regulator GbsR (MarR family)